MAEVTVRPARADEHDFLARMVNQAGEGLPLHIWASAAGQGDPWDWGRMRIMTEASGLYYRKGHVAEVDGRSAGCVFAYEKGLVPEEIDPDGDPMFRPLALLENRAVGTGYVFILATEPLCKALVLERRSSGLQSNSTAARTG